MRKINFSGEENKGSKHSLIFKDQGFGTRVVMDISPFLLLQIWGDLFCHFFHQMYTSSQEVPFQKDESHFLSLSKTQPFLLRGNSRHLKLTEKQMLCSLQTKDVSYVIAPGVATLKIRRYFTKYVPTM